MLGVVTQNLIEITLLVNKLGVPRHAFLAFLNNGVMGSMFTAYKSPAMVNLDWTTTFTPELLRKDLDLGLALADEADVPMPVTAATRAILQMHMVSCGVWSFLTAPEMSTMPRSVISPGRISPFGALWNRTSFKTASQAFAGIQHIGRTAARRRAAAPGGGAYQV